MTMRRTLLYVCLSTFLFSSMEIALKLAGASFAPVQLNFLRFLIGGLVLSPLAFKHVKQKQLKLLPHWSLFALTGFVCVIVSMTFFQLAVVNAKAATVAVLFSCNPVFALLFSFLILHERLGRASLFSVVISVVGLLVIINPAHLSQPFGLTLAIISAVTFGLYSIISRYGSQKYGYDGITMTAMTFLFGAFELMVVLLLGHIPAIAKGFAAVGLSSFSQVPLFAGLSLATLPLMAYIGIGVTGLGFAFYFLAMERSDVATASLVFFIKPGLAPILAAIILHETVTVNTIIGIIIILLGSTLTFVNDEFMEKVSRMIPWRHSEHRL